MKGFTCKFDKTEVEKTAVHVCERMTGDDGLYRCLRKVPVSFTVGNGEFGAFWLYLDLCGRGSRCDSLLSKTVRLVLQLGSLGSLFRVSPGLADLFSPKPIENPPGSKVLQSVLFSLPKTLPKHALPHTAQIFFSFIYSSWF